MNNIGLILLVSDLLKKIFKISNISYFVFTNFLNFLKKGEDLQFDHMNIKTTNVKSIDNDKVVIRDFELSSKYHLFWITYLTR